MDACLGGHGAGGAACCLGEKAGVPTGQQGGSLAWGNSGNKELRQDISGGSMGWVRKGLSAPGH